MSFNEAQVLCFIAESRENHDSKFEEKYSRYGWYKISNVMFRVLQQFSWLLMYIDKRFVFEIKFFLKYGCDKEVV